MPNVFEELNAERSELLSYEAMVVAVASMKQKLEKRNEASFHCCVLEPKDVENFVKKLAQSVEDIPDGSRFQLIFDSLGKRRTSHWSTCDIVCNKDGKLGFFFLEPTPYLANILPMLMMVKKYFPEGKIKLCLSRIQNDWESCSFYSLNFVKNLIKIRNLHQELQLVESENISVALLEKDNDRRPYRQIINDFFPADKFEDDCEVRSAIRDFLGEVKIIDIKNFPLQYGSLLKNIQSVKKNSFFKETGYQCANKKPLIDSINEHTILIRDIVLIENTILIREETINNGIYEKAKKIKKDAKNYVESLCSYSEISDISECQFNNHVQNIVNPNSWESFLDNLKIDVEISQNEENNLKNEYKEKGCVNNSALFDHQTIITSLFKEASLLAVVGSDSHNCIVIRFPNEEKALEAVTELENTFQNIDGCQFKEKKKAELGKFKST